MRMTTTTVAHFGSRRNKVFRRQEAEKYPFISPGMRRLLPKLIIPCCILISSVILLIIFLYNRPVSSLPQTVVSHKTTVLEVKKADMETMPKKNNPYVAAQETAPSAEYRRFYKEESAARPHLGNALKRKTSGDINIQVLQASAHRELAESDDKARAVSAGLFEKDPLRVPEFARSGRAVTSEALASSKIPGKGPSDRQLQSDSHGQEDGAQVRTPKVGSDDAALNVKYGDLETEVFLFLVRYIQAYEEGDITKFMGFFSLSAVENGNMRYEDMRRSYRKNFEISKYSYTLKNINIKSRDSDVIATADYSIKRIAGEDKGQAINGKMHWTLGRESGNLKIMRMDYDRR